jgi:hypothetical protein
VSQTARVATAKAVVGLACAEQQLLPGLACRLQRRSPRTARPEDRLSISPRCLRAGARRRLLVPEPHIDLPIGKLLNVLEIPLKKNPSEIPGCSQDLHPVRAYIWITDQRRSERARRRGGGLVASGPGVDEEETMNRNDANAVRSRRVSPLLMLLALGLITLAVSACSERSGPAAPSVAEPSAAQPSTGSSGVQASGVGGPPTIQAGGQGAVFGRR